MLYLEAYEGEEKTTSELMKKHWMRENACVERFFVPMVVFSWPFVLNWFAALM